MSVVVSSDFFRFRLALPSLLFLSKDEGYKVNFLSTASGTVDQCTILTPSPQRHLALIFYPDQIPDSDVKLAKSYDT